MRFRAPIRARWCSAFLVKTASSSSTYRQARSLLFSLILMPMNGKAAGSTRYVLSMSFAVRWPRPFLLPRPSLRSKPLLPHRRTPPRSPLLRRPPLAATKTRPTTCHSNSGLPPICFIKAQVKKQESSANAKDSCFLLSVEIYLFTWKRVSPSLKKAFIWRAAAMPALVLASAVCAPIFFGVEK